MSCSAPNGSSTLVDRGRSRARRRRRDAAGDTGRPGRGGPLVAAGADLSRRDRRRRGRDRARPAPRPSSTAPFAPGSTASPSCWPTATCSNWSAASADGVEPRCRRPAPLRMPDVPEAFGRLLRRAGHGPGRSVHRLRRHARRHRRGRVPDRGAAGRRGATRSCRWPARRPASALVGRASRGGPGAPGATRDPRGIDVAAIEHLDARSIAVVREDGVDRKLDITLPSGTGIVLLIELELPRGGCRRRTVAATGDRARDGRGRLAAAASSARCSIATAPWTMPRSRCRATSARAAAFAELREAVPAGVNRRVALAQQQIDPAHLQDRRRHDRAVRSLRRDDAHVPAAVRRARSRPGGVGAHLRRQRPSQRHPDAVRPT